jgi:hypothetical protein
MPWKECHVMDERVRFVVRLLNGDAVVITRRESAPSPTALQREEDGRRNPDDKGAEHGTTARTPITSPQSTGGGKPSHQNIRSPNVPWTAATATFHKLWREWCRPRG